MGCGDALPLHHLGRHIFLELATGGDLFSYMVKNSTLCEGEAKFISYQLMKGLEVWYSTSQECYKASEFLKYIHSKGMAHRGESVGLSHHIVPDVACHLADLKVRWYYFTSTESLTNALARECATRNTRPIPPCTYRRFWIGKGTGI
jgi:hypothetical protein